MNFDPEIAFVWFLTDSRFKENRASLPSKINWDVFNWNEAISYARHNRVLFKFCLEALSNWKTFVDEDTASLMKQVVERAKYDLERLKKTLGVIGELWNGKVDYYVIKTNDDAPTCDADVLFRHKVEYELAISWTNRFHYDFVREEPFKGWIGVPDGIKIELHHGISWFGMQALDNAFLFANPRRVRLMNFDFPTLSKAADLALDLAHWIMDVQPLTLKGFSKLVSNIEETDSWKEIILQSEKYSWNKQLLYHISIVDKLCKFIYGVGLDLPVDIFDIRMRPSFPLTIPIYVKVPFLIKKTVSDNTGFKQRFNMAQLALRRYVWTRMWQ